MRGNSRAKNEAEDWGTESRRRQEGRSIFVQSDADSLPAATRSRLLPQFEDRFTLPPKIIEAKGRSPCTEGLKSMS